MPTSQQVDPPKAHPLSSMLKPDSIALEGPEDPILAKAWIEVQAVLQSYIQREQFETWFRRAELRRLDTET
ncbi:MAG: hypothetical protein ACYTFV_10115, partial [Planctomycetota bacterium]